MLPFMGTIVIPALILHSTGAVNVGWGLPAGLNLLPPLIALGLIGAGLFLMLQTISLFATLGQGTLAPWDPTRRLVVRGVYRYVRNPMISGVSSILLGEAAFLGSQPLLTWFLVFFAINAVYIPVLEERSLRQRFGDDYLLYKRNVPRWIPRLTPWAPPF